MNNNNTPQQYFKLDENRDAELIQTFNFFEKGSDCLVIHPGSHTTKIGLASQFRPFLIPTAIGHPTFGTPLISTIPLASTGAIVGDDPLSRLLSFSDQKQQVFNSEYSSIIGPIETDLRKKKHLLIDPKSARNIREGKVSYKVWNEANSMAKYEERMGEYGKREKGAVQKNWGAVSTPMV